MKARVMQHSLTTCGGEGEVKGVVKEEEGEEVEGMCWRKELEEGVGRGSWRRELEEGVEGGSWRRKLKEVE